MLVELFFQISAVSHRRKQFASGREVHDARLPISRRRATAHHSR